MDLSLFSIKKLAILKSILVERWNVFISFESDVKASAKA